MIASLLSTKWLFQTKIIRLESSKNRWRHKIVTKPPFFI